MAKFIKVKFPLLLLLLISFVLFCFITACGNGADSSTDSGSGTTTASPTITLSVSNVTYGTPVTATATVRNSSGTAIQGVVVTFSADSGLVSFTPTSATALTNASGVASITVNAASLSSAGATNITASSPLIVNGTATTVTSNPVGISVGGASVTLGTLTVGTSPISAYGTSSLSVPVLINGSPATIPISVTFISACGATLSSPVNSSAGTAISTYKDNGCASGTSAVNDTITASVTSGATSAANITVQPTLVYNIQFVSASPKIIGVKGTGSPALPQSSSVTFKVVDNTNTGKSGVNVAFSLLPTSVSGTGVTFSPSSANSGSDGTVSTTVTSGTVPTPLWVVATTTVAPIVSSQSNTLTITTGLPTQTRFSLAVETWNIEGWGIDNVPDKVTALAFDRLGNPVPDGTAINFYSEAAGFNSASCSTVNGSCSVTFLSQNSSRPSDGRITIMASGVGEKSFIDANANNAYDSGETFYDLGARYIDNDEDGQWDTGEQILDYFNPTTSVACTIKPGSSALPSDYAKSVENSCDATWDINYVRDNNVIILSSHKPHQTSYTVTMGSACHKSSTLSLNDENGNAMPAGTTLSIGSNSVYYLNSSSDSTTATVSIDSGSPVANSYDYGTTFVLTVDGPDCTSSPSGTVNVIVTSPKGHTTTIPITVN